MLKTKEKLSTYDFKRWQDYIRHLYGLAYWLPEEKDRENVNYHIKRLLELAEKAMSEKQNKTLPSELHGYSGNPLRPIQPLTDIVPIADGFAEDDKEVAK